MCRGTECTLASYVHIINMAGERGLPLLVKVTGAAAAALVAAAAVVVVVVGPVGAESWRRPGDV